MDATDLPADLLDALVVAVDDSPSSRGALRFGADLAAGLGRPLHVLSAWNFITGAAPQQDPDAPPSVSAWQAEAERRLAAMLSEELSDRPGLDVRPVVVHGNTVPTLLAASELAAHLIVGNRGRGGFSALLLGSTSEQLVRHAACPVTVVRPRTTR
jgi:nucleotide-binding universal stress UspA family protein